MMFPLVLNLILGRQTNPTGPMSRKMKWKRADCDYFVLGVWRICPATLLRLLRRAPEPNQTVPRVVGVEDWARRKGHTDGTILVDLEWHRPIDLLPDREPGSLITWLRDHPSVEIITRDRSIDYV